MQPIHWFCDIVTFVRIFGDRRIKILEKGVYVEWEEGGGGGGSIEKPRLELLDNGGETGPGVIELFRPWFFGGELRKEEFERGGEGC